MANASNVLIIQTANTFDQWRIRDNLVANDVNEIARGNFVKPTGSVNIAEGTLTLSNTSTTTLLTVKSGARIDATLSVDTIESDQDGHVYLASGYIGLYTRRLMPGVDMIVSPIFLLVLISFTPSMDK